MPLLWSYITYILIIFYITKKYYSVFTVEKHITVIILLFYIRFYCFKWICNRHLLYFLFNNMQNTVRVLYHIVLYRIVLYWIVLYCTVLCCTVLYCTVLYRIALYCIVLYCAVMYCIVLYCIVLYCIVTHYITSHKTWLIIWSFLYFLCLLLVSLLLLLFLLLSLLTLAVLYCTECRWVGFIKDYDGGTLMECYVHPGLDYLNVRTLPLLCCTP